MNEIEKVLKEYLDGSYEGDSNKFRSAFHSPAHVYGSSPDGELRAVPIDDFTSMIAKHPSPKESGQKQEDEILAIDSTGENTAVARVRLRMGNVIFTDILSLIRSNGRWGIIAKLYSGVAD